MATCPAGHPSTATDYCDVCGVPIDPAAPTVTAPPASASGAPGTQSCPSCDTPNALDALFCEACGYDFTTGSMPRPLDPPEALVPPPAATVAAPATPPAARTPPAAAPASPPDATPPTSEPDFSWVVEIWIDPAWYAAQESPDKLPSAGLPVVRPLRGRSLLVGRTSASRNIHPDVECESDTGVSRRQCQLTTDGSRWWVEDLDSANGTFVGHANGTLPKDPVPVGSKHELGPDDRIYVGAWTRLVIRAATDDERSTLG